MKLTPSKRSELATQIMAGLLASGHYTEMVEEEDTPRPLRLDVGKEWKEVGSRQRFICHAVEDAVSLLKDLEDEVSAKFPAPRPLTVPPGYQILPGGRWQMRHPITGKWINTESPHSSPVEALVAGIDFPHLRDGGQWMQKGAAPTDEPAFSFARACHYARQLRVLGVPDVEIQTLLSDLYWDATTEMDLNRKAMAAETVATSLP